MDIRLNTPHTMQRMTSVVLVAAAIAVVVFCVAAVAVFAAWVPRTFGEPIQFPAPGSMAFAPAIYFAAAPEHAAPVVQIR